MRITSIEAIPVSYPEPNDHGRDRSVCLVKLTTDEGHVGWGEAATYFLDASTSCAVLVEALAPLVVGRDPIENGSIWRSLRDQTWWYGTGTGIASFAISAIDIALWDLKGHVLGVSVLDLLGGPAKDALPAMASGHATKADLGELADEIAGWLSTGLQGIKTGFGKLGDANLGFDQARDVEFVRTVRERIGDKAIMVDLGVRNHWDVPTAIARARAFEEHDVYWLEEPLGHHDPAGYATLRAATSTRIAYGEREWNVGGVEAIVTSGTVDVVGIDPGRMEGITGFAKACDVCELHRRQANAHAWSTAVISAASVAVSWSTPVCRQYEIQPVFGVMQQHLVDRPVQHRDGWMPRPEGPGLGIEVQDDVVERFRVGRR